jgi:hypothetical protein
MDETIDLARQDTLGDPPRDRPPAQAPRRG